MSPKCGLLLRLCIDSAGDSALLVLGHSTGVLGFCEILPQHNADRIAPFLDGLQELLNTHQRTIAELEAISIVTEPGRFTGLRLGMAMAQGLVLNSAKPLLPIKREAAYAPLMRAPQGLFLCESGKAQAFGGYWKDGVCAPLQLWPAQESPYPNILSLLDETALREQYPIFQETNAIIDYPTLTQRANALLSLIHI